VIPRVTELNCPSRACDRRRIKGSSLDLGPVDRGGVSRDARLTGRNDCQTKAKVSKINSGWVG